MLTAQLRTLENAYLSFEEGLIPQSALDGYGGTIVFPSLDGFSSEYWPRIRSSFDPGFVAFLEARWRS